MSNKPTLPKGTRDFGPQQMVRRTYILDTIRQVFQKFGFQPLETPSIENLSVLTGKYGDEGDQLLFKVLDSGDFYKSVREEYRLSAKEIGLISLFFNDLLKKLKVRLSDVKFWDSYKNEQNKLELEKEILEKIEDVIDQRDPDFIAFERSSVWEMLKKFFRRNEYDTIRFLLVEYKGKYPIVEKSDSTSFEIITAERLVGRFSMFFTKKYLEDRRLKDISALIVNDISSKGLRYDLTVPFARYVVMNQHEITFPFKRYQIQPVWRADRPQKGRYREFYQCDADVVGTDSLLCEAEIIRMLEEAFDQLGIKKYSINLNHRQILNGLVEAIGAQGKESDLLVAIDKLDKIGKEKVIAELQQRRFSDEAIQKLSPVFSLQGSTQKMLSAASAIIDSSEVGQQGIAELREVLNMAQSLGSSLDRVRFDLTLARGLSYYTGTIFEVKAQDTTITSSISGGGRYDNLTGVFGLPGVSGVGISFGVDRIYDVMEDLNLFSEENSIGTQVLLINFDKELQSQVIPVLSQLRNEGIRAEMYPDAVKLKKQFGYADKKSIPYALVIGTNEMASGQYSLKNLKSGEQQSLSLVAIVEQLRASN